MASLSYPLTAPTNVLAPSSVSFTPENVVAVSTAPFSLHQQVFRHPGQRWLVSVKIPPARKEYAEPWVSFLLALEGQTGTFYLGDPNNKSPKGTATYITLTGNAQARYASIYTRNGTLKAGDMIQIGSGTSSRLHKVLADVLNSSDPVWLWPRPTADISSTTPVNLINPVGLFRLKDATSGGYNISESSAYGISFECVGVV